MLKILSDRFTADPSSCVALWQAWGPSCVQILASPLIEAAISECAGLHIREWTGRTNIEVLPRSVQPCCVNVASMLQHMR